jgi:hypothetical protein
MSARFVGDGRLQDRLDFVRFYFIYVLRTRSSLDLDLQKGSRLLL